MTAASPFTCVLDIRASLGECPLWSIEDVVITSHAANTWEMALPELADRVRRNVERFARGEPLEGLVDVRLGY